ncbi:hypothetical protein DL771_006560 [Monosporascus sp. 5C6A]|nr:hypothetical protein DL771_006560 [Monosporascus sp. 5C6A]
MLIPESDAAAATAASASGSTQFTRFRSFPGVALITGAGGTGIAAAVAKGFARSGCSRIAITDINKKALDNTGDAIPDTSPKAQVMSRDGDVPDEIFVDSLARDISKSFSRLDYAVNCAGILGNDLRST